MPIYQIQLQRLQHGSRIEKDSRRADLGASEIHGWFPLSRKNDEMLGGVLSVPQVDMIMKVLVSPLSQVYISVLSTFLRDGFTRLSGKKRAGGWEERVSDGFLQAQCSVGWLLDLVLHFA